MGQTAKKWPMLVTNESSSQRMTSELLRLARTSIIDEGDLEKSFDLITESLVQGLQVERASIWFYDESGASIICQNQYDSIKKEHTCGHELSSSKFPIYFSSLTEERTIPSTFAESNPATKELNVSYLRPNNIKSLLDAPIRVKGKMIGVICSEQLGQARHWTTEEQNFVGNISDFVSRAILAKEKVCALQDLAQMKSCLEELVQERTKQVEDQRSRLFYSSKMASLGEMASGIAHEINNPLTIILGNAYLIKSMNEDVAVNPVIMKEAVDRIVQTSFRIGKTINGLRYFSKDAHSDRPEEVIFSDVIEDTLALCKERFKSHGCQLELDIEEAQVLVSCQRVSLSQALLNLLNNSFDAIAHTNDKWIKISCKQTAQFLEIRIIDSGAGIPSHLQEKIMTPFFTSKPAGRGVGLGLSIVKTIIEKNGGEIAIDQECKNTCFIMKIPIVP